LLLLFALALTACSRHAAPEFQRIAILRFENLGSDSSAEWMGRAFSEIVTSELAGAPGIYAIPSTRIHNYERVMGARPVSAPGISGERELAMVAGANRLGYGDYSVSGGRLLARLTIENPQTGKMATVVASAAEGDVIAAASGLARQLWPAAPTYRSSHAPALKNYVAALEGSDPAEVVRNLEQAIAASPDFAPAYRLLAQLKAETHDAAGALAVIGQALSTDLRPLERARLEVAGAELRGDRDARLRALDLVSKLTPSDPTVWKALAEVRVNAHGYSQAVKDYERALAIEPQDANSLNQLGYACAYAGDLPAAMAALRRYQALRPADANPTDSMGDVNLLFGRLGEAENFYLQAAHKTPHFESDGSLFKAAMARLMAGDTAGADGLAHGYLDARAAEKDPALGYRNAEWSWVSGRRKEACAQMEAFARSAGNGTSRELAARAYGSLAVWKLILGDRAAGARMAQQAAAAAGPSTAEMVALARFLTSPPASPAEWTARAAHDFPGPARNPARDLALAYALLVAKQFQPASQTLQRFYESAEPADAQGSLPIMLAWTYLETGRDKEAAPLLRWNPIPAATGTGPLLSFCFPRIYYLRGLAEARAGHRDAAAANYQLFRKLSGPDPLIWEPDREIQRSP
jgi:Flp pilus assembly protein TadD